MGKGEKESCENPNKIIRRIFFYKPAIIASALATVEFQPSIILSMELHRSKRRRYSIKVYPLIITYQESRPAQGHAYNRNMEF